MIDNEPLIQWYRPLPKASPREPARAICVDGQARELQRLAADFLRDDPATAAFLFACAERLDRQAEQLLNLRPNDFDLGVQSAYDRVYSRANLAEERRERQSLADRARAKALAEAVAKAPIRRIPKGVSGLDAATNKPKVAAVEINLEDLGL